MSSPRISTQSPLSGCYGHLLGGHWPRAPRLDATPYRRSREFRQQDYTAVGMHEELDPITRLQPKMFTDSLGDGGLTLDGNRGFHISPLHIQKCNTTAVGCMSILSNSRRWCRLTAPLAYSSSTALRKSFMNSTSRSASIGETSKSRCSENALV